MRKRSQVQKFASKLLAISTTNGLLDEKKISAILEILPKTIESLHILREYYRLVERASINERLIIHSDRDVSDEQKQKLVTHFEQKFGRKLRTYSIISPELIAGIKIQIGDKIFEQSIYSTLATLKK